LPPMPAFHGNSPHEILRDIDPSPLWDRLFAALPDVVFCIKDLDLRYRSANQAFANRLGLPGPARVIGRTADELFPPHLAATYRQQDEHVLRTGEDLVDLLELVTNQDGSLGWYVTTKVRLSTHDGRPAGIASISRDLLAPCSDELELAGVARVVEHIRRHLDGSLRPAVLARGAGMSQAQLDRRMRRAFSLTTAQFIRKSRIERAAQLLATSEQPIVDIALACGYADQSSFTRQFHAAVGLPPAAYRSARRPGGRPGRTKRPTPS